MAPTRNHRTGLTKIFSDQPRYTRLHSNETRQSRVKGSSPGQHNICSRHQGRKTRGKDLRAEEIRRTPIGATAKGRTKMRVEAEGVIIKPITTCGKMS